MDVVLWSEDWDVAEVLIFLCLGAKIGLVDWDRLGLDADPYRETSGVEEHARGPGDNRTNLSPFKREHVYSYLEEIDLIVPETYVWTPLGTFIGYLSFKSQLEKFMPT